MQKLRFPKLILILWSFPRVETLHKYDRWQERGHFPCTNVCFDEKQCCNLKFNSTLYSKSIYTKAVPLLDLRKKARGGGVLRWILQRNRNKGINSYIFLGKRSRKESVWHSLHWRLFTYLTSVWKMVAKKLMCQNNINPRI